MQQLNVYFLPDLVEKETLAGSVCLMIDVLRASTTIITALANGADRFIVCATPEETREHLLSQRVDLIGGERGGKQLEGFQLGNSPDQYTERLVNGKRIGFTTTNGTRALKHASAAEKVYVASFVNLSSVCDLLMDVPVVNILCAGTNREVTREDVLAAGAITRFLLKDDDKNLALNDQALIAADAWLALEQQWVLGDDRHMQVTSQLKHTQGGSNLLSIGHGDDIAVAAALDRYNVVPIYDPTTQEIWLNT